MLLLQVPFSFVGYTVVFSVAALGCFLGAIRARRINHPDTRWGLVMFLLLVGLWSVFETARLVVPSLEAKISFYLLGLVVGLASGGAWLYFTSAYAGHSYHRNPTFRRIAVVLFVGLVTLKLTNPIHHLYFTARMQATPFPHLVIKQGLIHWGIAALLYFVAGIGFYMLFQLFVDSHVSTTSLGIVIMLAGSPIILDIFGFTGLLLELNYEPLGVAAFGIGALYFTEESFMAVRGFGRQQIIDNLTEAVILTDTEGRIQDYNQRAQTLFPELTRTPDVSITTIHPRGEVPTAAAPVADGTAPDSNESILQREHEGEITYYTQTVTPLTVGPHVIGRAYVFIDVTQIERQRRELQRQNDQLDGFAAAVSHELRNAVGIVAGHLDLAEQALGENRPDMAREAIETASERAERMSEIVGDLSTMARYSQTVTEPEAHEFAALVRTIWSSLDTEGLPLEIEGDGVFTADRPRIRELFRNIVLFAQLADAEGVSVRVTADGFTITISGTELTVTEPARMFEYGTAIPNAETGMLTANVQTLVQAHDWQIEAECDGTQIRFVISDVRIEPAG